MSITLSTAIASADTVTRVPAVEDDHQKAQRTADAMHQSSSGATPSIPEQTVAVHNRWRRQAGSPPLQWSNVLAAYAQEWADHLARSGRFQHREDHEYGENLFMSSRYRSIAEAVNQVVADEQPHYDPHTGTCKGGEECRHYTQVVWSTTAEVGCGTALRPDPIYGQLQYWVCNYSPPGNITGRKAY